MRTQINVDTPFSALRTPRKFHVSQKQYFDSYSVRSLHFGFNQKVLKTFRHVILDGCITGGPPTMDDVIPRRNPLAIAPSIIDALPIYLDMMKWFHVVALPGTAFWFCGFLVARLFTDTAPAYWWVLSTWWRPWFSQLRHYFHHFKTSSLGPAAFSTTLHENEYEIKFHLYILRRLIFRYH